MAPPTTPEKSGGKTRPGGNDDLIPLLIASNPDGLTLNYKRMKEIDPQKRTYYALEHKFRKFKARAKEICDAEAAKALEGGKADVEKASTAISSNQHEDLIPLIIACSGRLTLNFKRMSELDFHGRTTSSFEHKFRKYKAEAKDILDAEGGKASDEGDSNPKKTPTHQKRKTKGEGAQGEPKRRRVVKKEPKIASPGTEVADRAGVKKDNLDDEADRVIGANESAEEEPGAKTPDEESENVRLEAVVAKKRKPASQPGPRKKGLARILKKESTFLSETESDEKEELMKASSVRNKRKVVGTDKTEAKGKDSKGKPSTEFLAEDAASEPEGATAGVGESSGAPSKENAIRLLFD